MTRQIEVSKGNRVQVLTREQTMGERVSSGEFNLYDNARELGII